MTGSRRLSLGVVLASATMTVMAGSIIAPVLNPMRVGLGVSASSVGLVITTHGLFMALFSPLMGSIIDRRGAKRPYIIGLFCYGLAGGAGVLIDSYWVLLVGRAFLGIALAAIFTSITVLILHTYEGAARDKVMGWRGSAQSLGGVAWPLIGGALGGLSWHLPFAVYLLTIPIGIVAIFAVPEPRTAAQEGRRTDPDGSVFTILMENPLLFVIYGLMFFASLLLYAVVIFLPQLLETIGITSTFQIGLFLTVQALAGGITAFAYGTIRSHLSYRLIVTIAAALWSVAFASLATGTNSVMIIIASVCVFGVGNGLMMPSVMVWLGDVVPPSYLGRFGSYLGTLGFMGQFLSPVLFAPVVVLVSLNGVFLVGAGMGAAWVLILIVGMRRSTW